MHASATVPPPTADESAAAVAFSLETLMQTATDEADLAARHSAIGELGSYTLDDARARELLAGLAGHDPHPQVRDVAAMRLGEGR